MTTWAIGDLQGACRPTRALLDRIRFDPAADRLWFCGDLINRGGESLQTLRLLYGLREHCIVVLGNHDLHFLAQAETHPGDRAENEEFDEILAAPDAADLIGWLRGRRLLHVDEQLGYALVHAGIPPQWDRDLALRLAGELEAVLQSDARRDFFAHMYGKKPRRWRPELTGNDRLRLITNAFTRMRYCDAEGRLCLGPKGPPGSQPKGVYPWFRAPGRRRWLETIVFGHWSALGFYRGDGVIGLDTGYVWGGHLTAIALEEPDRVVQVPAR